MMWYTSDDWAECAGCGQEIPAGELVFDVGGGVIGESCGCQPFDFED